MRPRKPQTTITSQGSSAPRHSRTGNSAQAPLHRGRRPRGPGALTESAGTKFKSREKVSREKAPHPRGGPPLVPLQPLQPLNVPSARKCRPRPPGQSAGQGPRKGSSGPDAAPQPARSPIQGGVAEETAARPPARMQEKPLGSQPAPA